MSECTAATAKRRTQFKSGLSFHTLEAATLATPGNTLSCVQQFNSPFSIKALNKIKFHVAPSSDVTAATAAGDRSKSTCNEFSACGPEAGVLRREWQRALDFLHAIGSRELEGSLHVVLAPLALHHTSASHAQRSRNTAQALA